MGLVRPCCLRRSRPPGAQAAPTFRGLDRQGNLLTIERIKKVTRKNNGKKITTRFYAATEKVKVDADKER